MPSAKGQPGGDCEGHRLALLRLPVQAAAGALLLFLFLGLPARSVRAEGDTLYGALVMATNNDEHPAPVPIELRSQAKALEAVFGYNEFRLVAQKHQPLVTGTEDWLVQGRGFSLKIDTKFPVPGGYVLGVQLLRERQLLVEAEVKISRDRPCYIRGPFVGQGQVIILLMVQPLPLEARVAPVNPVTVH